MVAIGIIGAGMAGLATAINVQKLVPGARITIIADKFDKDTTSSGAAGLFRPASHLIKGVPPETIKAWVKDTWNFYSYLAMSPEAKDTGHSLVPGYVVSDDIAFVQNPVYEDIVFNFKMLTSEEMKRLNFPFKYGSSFTTVITQPLKFMPYLMRQFTRDGGSVEYRTVNKIEELADSYDIVVNCVGLGAKQLLNDHPIYPVRGQMEMIKAPWIKFFLYCESPHPTYFVPHDDYVLVGGQRERDDYKTDFRPEVYEATMAKAEKILPQIKGGEKIGDWVGLRPSREPLRLEKQALTAKGKKLRVVHNYGHGACGIALSWGTGIRAARMVEEWSREISVSANL